MNALEVRGLCAGYGGSVSVADVSFDLRPGEILCLAGESGCGKSTLLKALHGIAPGPRVLSGGIVLEGTDLSRLPERESLRLRRDRIGFVFQDPGSAFNPIRSYRRQFIETLKSHGRYDRAAFSDRADRAFSSLGLRDGGRLLNSCPYEMSGGMNQRMALALALLLDQRLLFADEPTSALDATIQLRVAQELLRLRDASGIAQIIVTHNLALARYLADRVGVMYAGRLVELGPREDVIARPRHVYTQCLLSAVPTLRGRMPSGLPGQPPSEVGDGRGCAFYPRCPRRQRACETLAYELFDAGGGHYSSCILANGGAL